MRKVRTFIRDEDGFVLAYGTLIIVILLGFATLAVDASRLKSHQTQLQKAADAAALAAAAELDGKLDSIERATRAINNIVSGTFQNRSIFGTASAANVLVEGADVRFFETLPTAGDVNNANGLGDNLAMTGPTAEPSKAFYAEVRVNRQPQGILTNTILPATLFGATSNQATATASAVAGHDEIWCEPTPLFICNPFETTTTNGSTELQKAIADQTLKRKLMMMRQVGGAGAQWFPGNFGLLLPPNGGNGASAILDLLARTQSNFCVRRRGVELKTGNLDPVRSAINVRFDIYEQGFSGNKNDLNYSPAPNVRKGYSYSGNACNAAPWDPSTQQNPQPDAYSKPPAPTDTVAVSKRQYQPLPLDDCFYSNTCPTGQYSPLLAGRIGDGLWNVETYWKVNHPNTPIPNGWSNANPPSRYEVYQFELGNGGARNQDPSLGPDGAAGPKGETGVPMCSSNKGTDPKRRVIYAAIMNCMQLDADPNYGPLNGASSGRLPAEALAEFFITQPILPQNYKGDADSDKKLYVEFIDIVSPSAVTQKIVHDVVRLYR